MKHQAKNGMLRLLRLCPYSVLWRAVRASVKERRLPSSARPGAMIALLGLFCPLFWTALLRGASRSELLFHASHSGIVVCIGLLLMLAGLVKNN